ncbi:phBC6A51 family helix-turn-helix protein [Oceanobacillus massiliensis]|uniref:phBC6A51 family helix-turn-helix protein n=1 Tax=Oceanobacillus massiliensis TaxID=1465765 RepID=UPI00301B1953
MEELPKNRQHAAFLLATGMMDKTDIAKEVQVSRTTLWHWENNDERLRAEVDRLKQEFKTQGQNFLLGKVNAALQDIYSLSKNAESEKVRLEALKYISDHALGKATNKVELTTEIAKNNINDDILDVEYDVIDAPDE